MDKEKIMDTIYRYGLTSHEYFTHMCYNGVELHLKFMCERNEYIKASIFEDIMLQMEREQFDFITEIEQEYLIEQIEQDMF